MLVPFIYIILFFKKSLYYITYIYYIYVLYVMFCKRKYYIRLLVWIYTHTIKHTHIHILHFLFYDISHMYIIYIYIYIYTFLCHENLICNTTHLLYCVVTKHTHIQPCFLSHVCYESYNSYHIYTHLHSVFIYDFFSLISLRQWQAVTVEYINDKS